MARRLLYFIALLSAALLAALSVGPWLAVGRSLSTAPAPAFLEIAQRLQQSVAFPQTLLAALSVLTVSAVTAVKLRERALTAPFALLSLGLLIAGLCVTELVEARHVAAIQRWSMRALPQDWALVRERWAHFEALRCGAWGAAFVALLCGICFEPRESRPRVR